MLDCETKAGLWKKYVTHIHKICSKTDPKNYRPISLLPLISKIIEKIIHDQTQNFLDKNNVIYRHQSGFRKFYSTDSCLSYLNNKITTGFESGLFTGMIFIDFDTINHSILIKKMTFLGFSEETTNWFKSYLTNRKFIVHINNSFSEPGNLLCGVPQRSILGPLLFLLYINDMPQALHVTFYCMLTTLAWYFNIKMLSKSKQC